MAKITYTNINGYLIPNLIYKSNEQMEQLGRYGIPRKNYLKKHKNSIYQSMSYRELWKNIYWKQIKPPENEKN